MPIVAQAVLLGGNVRVGLEDNLYLRRGVFASNAQLVEKAVGLVESARGTTAHAPPRRAGSSVCVSRSGDADRRPALVAGLRGGCLLPPVHPPRSCLSPPARSEDRPGARRRSSRGRSTFSGPA